MAHYPPIAGYQVLQPLGRGGMGIVYLAQDTRAGNRVVALKVLPFAFSHDETLARRFRREAQAIRRLHHRNIIRIYEAGQSGDISFIAMEYIDGGSLQDRMKPGRPLDWNTTVRIVSQVASALDHAHSRRIVHRDIKPSNILLTRDRRAILSDFGLAKVSEASWYTDPSAVMGTPHYMAPEQARGTRGVDHRCDIYALGVVCYEMLTGHVPFERPTAAAVLHAHAYEPTPPPRQSNPRITPQVEEVVLHALEKEPDTRYQSASALATDLRAGTLSPEARTRVRVSRSKDRAMSPQPRTRQESGLGRVALLAVAVVGLVLLAVFTLSNLGRTPPQATPAIGSLATVVPGSYSVGKSFTQKTPYDAGGQRGTYSTILTLDRVEVSKQGMIFFLTELVIYSDPDHRVRVNKKSDVGNTLVYVTDNLGHRYDQVAAGGAFAQSMTMEHKVPAAGWFRFPPPQPGAHTFTFRMDDQHVVIENIVLR